MSLLPYNNDIFPKPCLLCPTTMIFYLNHVSSPLPYNNYIFLLPRNGNIYPSWSVIFASFVYCTCYPFNPFPLYFSSFFVFLSHLLFSPCSFSWFSSKIHQHIFPTVGRGGIFHYSTVYAPRKKWNLRLKHGQNIGISKKSLWQRDNKSAFNSLLIHQLLKSRHRLPRKPPKARISVKTAL